MRVRVRYAKVGKVRFTSHRDVVRIWERALRRVSLPVAYTEGFSPRPRLSFGLALSTGHESDAEYLDVDLDEGAGGGDVDVAALPARLSAALPVGIDATAAAVVPRGTDSLQQAVTSCAWRIEVLDAPLPRVAELVAGALAADELVVTRERKGREVVDDLRPAVLDLAVAGPTADGVELTAELAVHPRSVRPSELVAALGAELEEGRVRRTHQWISRHGARQEPLDPAVLDDATSRPHAEARAS